MKLVKSARFVTGLLAAAVLSTTLMGAASTASVNRAGLVAEGSSLLAKERLAHVTTGAPQRVEQLVRNRTAPFRVLGQRYASGEGAYAGFRSAGNSGQAGAVVVLVARDGLYALGTAKVTAGGVAGGKVRTYGTYAEARRASAGLLPATQPVLYRG